MSPTAPTPGVHFEIKVDGIVRTHRDVRETAIEAARNLQLSTRGAKVVVTALLAGSVVPFDRPA